MVIGGFFQNKYQSQDDVPDRWYVLQINWISQAFAQVLPFVAGDAVRVILLREHRVPLKDAIETALIDRGLAVAVLFAIAAVGGLTSPVFWAAEPYAGKLAFVIGFGLIAAIVGLAVAPWLRRLTQHIDYVSTVFDAACGLRELLTQKSIGPFLILLAALVHLLSVLMFWLISRGCGAHLLFADALIIAPLLVLVTMIPFAIGGWGLRETFLVLLLENAGVGAETSLLLSVLFGIVNLFAALPGFFVLALSSFENFKAAPISTLSVRKS